MAAKAAPNGGASGGRGRRAQQATLAGPRVVIVGAGYAGLALARALQLAGVSAVVYEQDGPPSQMPIYGELRVPSAERVLTALGLRPEWEALRANGSQPYCLDFHGLRDTLASSLQRGSLHCERRVVSVTRRGTDKLWLEFADGGGVAAHLAVVASGMTVPCVAREALPQTAAVGDVRWAHGRWWDFGSGRIRCGANMALTDAMELSEMLRRGIERGDAPPLELGAFAASRRRWPDGSRRRLTQPRPCLSRVLVILAAATTAATAATALATFATRPSLPSGILEGGRTLHAR